MSSAMAQPIWGLLGGVTLLFFSALFFLGRRWSNLAEKSSSVPVQNKTD